MTRRTDLLEAPVITIDEGAEAGRVTGLIIDAISARIVALAVSTEEPFEAPKAVPFPLVARFWRRCSDDREQVCNNRVLLPARVDCHWKNGFRFMWTSSNSPHRQKP